MPSPRVKRAIKAFEKAVEDRTSFRQPFSPLEWVTVEHNYVKARAKLERLLENV